jgi:hypothetical protein
MVEKVPLGGYQAIQRILQHSRSVRKMKGIFDAIENVGCISKVLSAFPGWN